MDNKSNKNVRSITLCGKYNGNTRVPELRLTGLWLENLGFDIGRTVEITPRKGKLIIKAGENKYENEPKYPEISHEEVYHLRQLAKAKAKAEAKAKSCSKPL